MTPDAVLREWFQKVWNEGDESTISRLAHPEAVVHGLANPDGSPVRGVDAFIRFFHAFRGAFPGVRVSVERTISEGAYAMGHCVVTGKHTGKGLPIGPTHKEVRFEGACLIRVEQGRIVEAWNFFDFLTFYQQLGVVSAPGA